MICSTRAGRDSQEIFLKNTAIANGVSRPTSQSDDLPPVKNV